jgi:hypothetical protein
MAVSVAATLAGLGALLAFNGTAGAQSAGPERWPERSAIQRSLTAPTILIFAHPLCSCTAATLEELDRALAKRRRGTPAPAIRILFSRLDPTWRPGELWRRATEIAGALPMWDEQAKEARLFGAKTSGLVFLYDPGGKLLFQGGITGSRGHSGGNYGAEMLDAALYSGRATARVPTQVFGCALFGDSPAGNLLGKGS